MSANQKRCTRKCSRSRPFRDGAITRRHACSSITWKALRRKRIFLRVVQRSKPRLTNNGKGFLCKAENVVPLFVPGLSSSSGTSSSSTSPPQDSSSTSPSPELQRSDEQAPGDCCRELPQWLEEFTDNLEDTDTPVPAHVSQDSGSEHPTKVVSQFRKHCIEVTSKKNEIAKCVYELR